MIARITPVSFLPLVVHTYSSSSEDCICIVRCGFVYLLFLLTVEVRSHRDSKCPGWLSMCPRYLLNRRKFSSLTLGRFPSRSFFVHFCSSLWLSSSFYAWFAVLWYSWCPYFYAIVSRPTHLRSALCILSNFSPIILSTELTSVLCPIGWCNGTKQSFTLVDGSLHRAQHSHTCSDKIPLFIFLRMHIQAVLCLRVLIACLLWLRVMHGTYCVGSPYYEAQMNGARSCLSFCSILLLCLTFVSPYLYQ